MTATQATYSSGNGAGRFLLLVLLAVLVGLAGAVLLSSHATERHGLDAELIRQCIQRSGPAETWQRRDDANVHYWLCQIPDGRWCVSVVQFWPADGADYRERTSFCIGNGTYQKAIRYLSRFAERLR
jgi:hypothetical protein